jgi:hypothetical protein
MGERTEAEEDVMYVKFRQGRVRHIIANGYRTLCEQSWFQSDTLNPDESLPLCKNCAARAGVVS